MSEGHTVLVACARDEASNINEWIVYNLSLGFDKIYLYCNDDDPYPLFKTVFPYTVGNDPVLTFVWHKEVGHQKAMYRHFINHFMNVNDWIAFIDIDEFITLREGGSITDVIGRFPAADAIHLCWWNFGPGNFERDPDGLVLQNYTRRKPYPEPNGKVLIKAAAIDLAWINEGSGTFFHGFGDQGMDRKHRPFSEQDPRIVTSWGDNFYDLYESSFSTYAQTHRDQISKYGYISHFQMRSFEHLVRRAKRRIEGDFLDQSRWRDVLRNNSFWQVMALDNAEEDTFLRDHFAAKHFLSF